LKLLEKRSERIKNHPAILIHKNLQNNKLLTLSEPEYLNTL
jgi:hypothetical protein